MGPVALASLLPVAGRLAPDGAVLRGRRAGRVVSPVPQQPAFAG